MRSNVDDIPARRVVPPVSVYMYESFCIHVWEGDGVIISHQDGTG